MSRLRIAIGTGATALLLAVGTGATTTPAMADQGGVKPLNYGDCVSAIATGHTIGGFTVRTFNELNAPAESQGVGNADQIPFQCGHFPPPPGG